MADKQKTAVEGEKTSTDKTISLRKSIPAHGETVKELSFREPTGGDIERYGMPVTYDFSTDPPRLVFDEKKMAAMMSNLAAVPPSSIRALDPRDWTDIAWELAPFFVPGMGTKLS